MVNAGRHMDEESGKKEEEKLEFATEGEALGYISLDQARILALRLAREDISVYGEQYSETRFAWEVTDAEDGEDYYQIRISFRRSRASAENRGPSSSRSISWVH